MRADPLAARGGRCEARIRAVLMPGSHHQNASLPQEPIPFRRGQRNAAELRPLHIGDAVVPRQLLVQKCVVGAPEFDRIVIFTQLT